MSEPCLERIMLATDLSEASTRAAGRAVQWAHESGAALEAVHVLPYVMPPVDSYEDVDQAHLTAAMYHEAEVRLKAQLAEVAVEGVGVNPVVISGSPVPALLEQMDQARAQVAVVGAHGHRTFGDRLLGSTADRMVRRGHRPTLVVRQPATAPYQRVLVAVDFSEQSARALGHALAWFGAKRVSVLHVIDAAAVDQLRGAGLDEATLSCYDADLQARFNTDLGVFVREAGVEPGELADCVVRPGYPGDAVLAEMGRQAADLLVLGTHGRNRLADMVLGGVALRVLHAAEGDVLLV